MFNAKERSDFDWPWLKYISEPSSEIWKTRLISERIFRSSLQCQINMNLITPPARRAWRSYKFAPFLFFFPCRKSAHRSWVTPLCIVWATTLNSISSGICHQNTQFNMYTTTSKQQEGCTFEDSHPKCFITTNSTAKLSRGAVNRGDVHVLRASYTKVNSNTVCNYFNFIWHNGLSLLYGNCSISLSLRSEKITWQSRDPWRLFAYVDRLMLAVSI